MLFKTLFRWRMRELFGAHIPEETLNEILKPTTEWAAFCVLTGWRNPFRRRDRAKDLRTIAELQAFIQNLIAEQEAQEARKAGFACPSCGRLLYMRKVATCGYCGAALPEDVRIPQGVVQKMAEDEQRRKRWKDLWKDVDDPPVSHPG